MKSEQFGQLLKAGIASITYCERKTAPVVEADLGAQIGVEATTIQRYKTGHLPPELRTTEILAEAAVKRGYLNREWLQNFLHAAQYPAPERLLDKLCPTGPVRQRPPRIYENLPAPTYSQFVMRQQAFAEVIDGLQQRSAVILIVGLGGNGKTSLAREVAARCLNVDEDVPQFSAVVWCSDKDRPGTTNLSVVLDEIAHTLDYPGITQFAPDEKRREVDQLLKRQRVLVIVDNFETITDEWLLRWLLRLPEPSKALITSREYGREFRRNCWPVELRGMSDAEALVLINQRLRLLRMEHLIGDVSELEPLVMASGGNPKAIEVALGLLKYEHRALLKAIDDLYAARGDLFNDLFGKAWEVLDESARRLLLAMPLFASSMSAEALIATSGVTGFGFDRAIEQLSNLALVDVRQTDLRSAPRYALHPLVRSFAQSKLTQQPDLEEVLRERWIAWYHELVSQVGYCWNDLKRLNLLDLEQETIHSVMEWALANQRYAETIKIFKGVGYYYYIRGLWERKPRINLIGAEAAAKLTDTIEEAEALAYLIQVLCKQGNINEAAPFLPRLQEIASTNNLPKATYFEFKHALALYMLTSRDFDTAERIWQQLMPLSQTLDVRAHIANRRWLATCLYVKGQMKEAQLLLREALNDALQHNYTRGIVSIQTILAKIDLDLGNIDSAAEALASGSVYVGDYQERRHTAELQRTYARLHALRGDFPAARMSLAKAIDLFERLGIRRELAEAREELARLETGAAPTPAPAI